MPVPARNLILYAADPTDYALAVGVAGLVGLPFEQVTGQFVAAWLAVASGNYLVVAVGGPANIALYYNPCGWDNPAQSGPGSTPFLAMGEALATLPPPNQYLNGAGQDRDQTVLRTFYLATYALTGTGPSGWASPPPAVEAVPYCLAGMSSQVSCPC